MVPHGAFSKNALWEKGRRGHERQANFDDFWEPLSETGPCAFGQSSGAIVGIAGQEGQAKKYFSGVEAGLELEVEFELPEVFGAVSGNDPLPMLRTQPCLSGNAPI